jgi:nucleoside-diphosphate-sugar epimerase
VKLNKRRKIMNVFMIGGTGLLGCEAAKQLIAHGHKVTTAALPPLPEGAPIPEEMEIIFGDINKKTDEELEELLSGHDMFILRNIITSLILLHSREFSLCAKS